MQKKNHNHPVAKVFSENDNIVIEAFLGKDDAISAREELKEYFVKLPKLNKSTFDEFAKDLLENYLDDFIREAFQKLADEEDKSTIESF